MVPSQKYVRNALLGSLPADDYHALAAALVPVATERGDRLAEPDRPMSHVMFVESGVVSTVACTQGGRRIEIGLVGPEGMVGAFLALGIDRSPHESFVQIAGQALSITAAAFRDLLDRRAAIRRMALSYAHLFHIQTAQTALSNGIFNLEERLARWLLMCHDRIEGDALSITHEFLATMLGVRRPGVTTAVHVLEGDGTIRARRSRIEILDRAKLEATAGDSYGMSEIEYRRIIGRRDRNGASADSP